MRLYTVSVCLLLSLVVVLPTQAEVVPFDSGRWKMSADEHRFTEYLGRPSLFLKGGKAWVTDQDLVDGVIEFDVAFTGERGFLGGIWRIQDGGNYEDFYLRPHQSGNPDANQYTPVFNGVSGWQLYHGKGYSTPVTYPTNTWIHVKIVFSGSRGAVYIDSDEPVLAIQEMKREVQAGKVGLSSSIDAHFSNFRVEKLDRPELDIPPPDVAVAPPGTVMEWSVSSPFPEASLADATRLDASAKESLTWQTLIAERTGITNLARVATRSQESNTVFARVVVHAESKSVKKLRFGYSDRVKVYHDDRLIYGGNNTYRTRDYRYLGTLGLFDEVYLPLRQGKNEIWFAVSESFGGWGVVALFEDPRGLRVEP